MHEDYSQNNKLQLLGKLNASFVHEIRNPLFALKLNLDYIRSTEIPEDIRDSFESCAQAVERIQILVDDVLNFSRKNYTDPIYCSLDSVTRQAVHLLEGYAHKTNCRIELECQENLPPVLIDKNKLLQVILNLVTNAIEAGEGPRNVIVKTYVRNSYVYWEVQDFGAGIKDEERDMIFDEFYTQKSNGTGLGLSICKKLLNESGSSLEFNSVPGSGTSFFIKFNLDENVLGNEH